MGVGVGEGELVEEGGELVQSSELLGRKVKIKTRHNLIKLIFIFLFGQVIYSLNTRILNQFGIDSCLILKPKNIQDSAHS